MGMKEATTAIGKARMGIKRRPKVKQEGDGDKADDGHFEKKVPLQRFDGGMNQARAVISGDDLNTLRGARVLSRRVFS